MSVPTGFFVISVLALVSLTTIAQPILQANVSRIVQNRQPVSVSIRGIEKPTASDVVAVYISAEPDLASSVPLKYKWLADSDEYLSTGCATEK